MITRSRIAQPCEPWWQKPNPAAKPRSLSCEREARSTLTVVLGERPEVASAADGRSGESSPSKARRMSGMKLQELRPDLAQRLGYEGEGGVLVVGVDARRTCR